MAHDVFISYSSKDKTIADAVCARVEAHGIRCWIAPRDVRPGLPYGEEIIDGIQASRVMVLVFSANANASAHIPKEIERAVSQGISIIPLRVEVVTPAKSLDYFISSVHWLDAITPPLEQHLDNLAETIRAVLQTKGVVRLQPPAPSPLPQPVPPPVPGAKKSPAKLLIGVLALVVLVAVGWFLWSKNSVSDPLVGCWQWFNSVPVTIRSDGTMTAASFTARWRLVDSTQHVYTLTWPEAVDNMVVARDERSLSGGNQYGFSVTAYRVSYGSGLVGAWRWPNGGIIVVRPDGTFTVGNIIGHWRTTNAAARSYAMTWPNPVDTVTLSADGQRVSGANQYGIPISGTRSAGTCEIK